MRLSACALSAYLPIVEAIEEEVLETEQRTLDAFLEREEIGRLFTLRRELIRFQRVLGPMHEVCNKLTHVSLPALDREVRPYFQDVLDHVRQVETRVGGLREILTSVFEAARTAMAPMRSNSAVSACPRASSASGCNC